MKFRTMLLASAAVMFTSSAFAEDFTNPFYLPSAGKVLSNTSIETSRYKSDNGKEEDVEKKASAREELTVGVMDNLALYGRLSNAFDIDDKYNNDHNFDYALGAKYNMNFDNVLAQTNVTYRTGDIQDFYGQGEVSKTGRWSKAMELEAKVGYNCDCGMTPYTSFAMLGEIDSSTNKQAYTWKLGVHKMLDKVAIDGALRYEFGKTFDDIAGEETEKVENLYLDLAADYYVAENMTLGGYASAYLTGHEHADMEYDNTFGLSAKVLF